MQATFSPSSSGAGGGGGTGNTPRRRRVPAVRTPLSCPSSGNDEEGSSISPSASSSDGSWSSHSKVRVRPARQIRARAARKRSLAPKFSKPAFYDELSDSSLGDQSSKRASCHLAALDDGTEGSMSSREEHAAQDQGDCRRFEVAQTSTSIRLITNESENSSDSGDDDDVFEPRPRASDLIVVKAKPRCKNAISAARAPVKECGLGALNRRAETEAKAMEVSSSESCGEADHSNESSDAARGSSDMENVFIDACESFDPNRAWQQVHGNQSKILRRGKRRSEKPPSPAQRRTTRVRGLVGAPIYTEADESDADESDVVSLSSSLATDEDEEGQGSSGEDFASSPVSHSRGSRKEKGTMSSSSHHHSKEKEIPFIDKILVSKKKSVTEWHNVMDPMSTHFIERGTHFISDDDGNKELEGDGDVAVERLLVKWVGLSHVHVSWELPDELVETFGPKAKSTIRRFRDKIAKARMQSGYLAPEDEWDGGFFDPGCLVVDRVLDVDQEDGAETRLLIKWAACGYADITYEYVSDLERRGIEFEEAVAAHHVREDVSARQRLVHVKRPSRARELELDSTELLNGGSLRDYQLDGINWMLRNWMHSRSCILGDEMGLGKTLQTLTLIHQLTKKMGLTGPFLVIAPLSTLGHWKQEAEKWTGLNTVIFHGSQEDRMRIEQYELGFLHQAGKAFRLQGGAILWKPQIIVTTPEIVSRDGWMRILSRMTFDILVVDEAHRGLKNHNSKISNVLRTQYDWKTCVLLTGTPLQNNTEELWSLLNFMDDKAFPSDEKESFMESFGTIDVGNARQVEELRDTIRPYLLRREKGLVEKDVPPKEETILEVELTDVQKQYYRAIYEKNTQFLIRGKTKSQLSLNNLAMELRKCCNHPFQIAGAEVAIESEGYLDECPSAADRLVKTAGKLVLLDKLLPHLKMQGHRVLIFSQFTTLLDIVDDYLTGRGYCMGRIDGSITGKERQRQIERFQAPGSDVFVMLLTTKAGGVGITLTGADTVIIYDSDWNPQNDLQAQARCHRIGQTKTVKVYRLLTRNTYEQAIFDRGCKKLGLGHAVLTQATPGAAPSAADQESLLRKGAYNIFNEKMDENGRSEASRQFCEIDIESILNRAQTVQHQEGGASALSFSKASFVSGESGDVDHNDPDFWNKVVGLSMPEKEKELGRRTAASTRKNYSEGSSRNMIHVEEAEYESYSSDSEADSGNPRGEAPSGCDNWHSREIQELLKVLPNIGLAGIARLAATLGHTTIQTNLMANAAIVQLAVTDAQEKYKEAARKQWASLQIPQPLGEEITKVAPDAAAACLVPPPSIGIPASAEGVAPSEESAVTNALAVTNRAAEQATAVSSLNAEQKSILFAVHLSKVINRYRVCRDALIFLGSPPNVTVYNQNDARAALDGAWRPRKLIKLTQSFKQSGKKLAQLDILVYAAEILPTFNAERPHARGLDTNLPAPFWTPLHDKWLLRLAFHHGWPLRRSIEEAKRTWPGEKTNVSGKVPDAAQLVKRLKTLVHWHVSGGRRDSSPGLPSSLKKKAVLSSDAASTLVKSAQAISAGPAEVSNASALPVRPRSQLLLTDLFEPVTGPASRETSAVSVSRGSSAAPDAFNVTEPQRDLQAPEPLVSRSNGNIPVVFGFIDLT